MVVVGVFQFSLFFHLCDNRHEHSFEHSFDRSGHWALGIDESDGAISGVFRGEG